MAPRLTSLEETLGLAIVIQSWPDTAHHNCRGPSYPSALVVLRVVGRSASQLVAPVIRLFLPGVLDGRCNCKHVPSPHEVWAFLVTETEPAGGNNVPNNGKCYGASPLRPCAAESVQIASSLRPQGGVWRWCGRKARIPRRVSTAVWKASVAVTHHGRTWGSFQEADAERRAISLSVDVENRRRFLTGADDAFRHRHATPSTLITVDEDRQVLLASAARMDPRGIIQGVDQSLSDRERRRLEPACSSGQITSVHTATRAAHRLVCRRTKKENGGTRNGTAGAFVPSAGIIQLNRPVPPSVAARRHTPSSLTHDLRLPDPRAMTPSPS
ncbi:hypothetical protein GWK47_030686 [Chionoecetes opilio]|uniref:Uncharacterized protein n=1 Tax=Chionoecetes opilio TaxID=41210 RepID=A0A8J4Z1C1_CHIOP|nr:hypothetical protein GWK47_030686 [Chionoecetes opilio]